MPADKSNNRIVRSIKISALPLLAAWIIVLVIPLAGSLLAIDYFIDEYALFAKPEHIEKARQQIEDCRDLLVTENFLASRLSLLENINLPAELQSYDNLQQKIDQTILGKGLLYLFFNTDGSKVTARSYRPPDLHRLLPPATLFRRPIQTLISENYLTGVNVMQVDNQAKQRNSMQLQQMFKAITPISIRPNQVAKNYSIDFGGEIYFAYFEFRKPQAGQKGCLAIIRGRDLSWPDIVRSIQQKHPAFKLVIKKQNIQKAISRPDAFFTGIRQQNSKIVITAPADQRFIRSYLHKGGITLDQKEPDFDIPFIEYHLPTENFQHYFQKIRTHLGIAAKVLIVISLIQLIHMLLFGINLDISFARRILASVMLVSIFPYTFFAMSFYLHQQYDGFLSHLNMLQHIEIRLTQMNNELKQFMEQIESTFISFGKRVDKSLFNDEAAIQKLFAEIGQKLPISAIAIHRPKNTEYFEFPEKISPSSQNSMLNIVERFIPRRALSILLEQKPVERIRQDIVIIAGNPLKNATIAELMMSNGKFYYVDQVESVIWYATLKLYDEDDSAMPFMGLMGGKFEAAPILDEYLSQTLLAAKNFEESYGEYKIKYAFFPTDRTGSKKIWAGSGHLDEPLLKKAAIQKSSNAVTETDSQGNNSYIISKYNHNIPHTATALAVSNPHSGSWLPAVGGLLAYLFMIFYLVSELLGRFFVAPVLALARSADQIARGKDVWNLSLETGDEFEQLNDSFAELVVGLQQRNMLRDYVSEDAISQIESSESKDMAPGGEYIEATIIFATIRNYAELTVDSTAEQTVELINRFITAGDKLVKSYGGTIDKIIDSTLMLVFRDSEAHTDSHALRAATTALGLASEMHQQNLDIYAGIASGTVISGRIGSYTGKLDFTVIGDQVNLAARLKTEAVNSASGLIISGSTMRLLKGKGRVNFLRRCSLKGKAREYNIYELYELR